TSARSAMVSVPAAAIASATRATFSKLRSARASRAPSRANFSAVACPMPLPAPVINATLFERRMACPFPAGSGKMSKVGLLDHEVVVRVFERGLRGVQYRGEDRDVLIAFAQCEFVDRARVRRHFAAPPAVVDALHHNPRRSVKKVRLEGETCPN